MDLKGITWAADTYEKFEAMCLEVEEAIYEDAIKYLENQVQKAGVSVKTFCADVMQDLLSPSSQVGPLKVVTKQDSTLSDDAEHLPLMPYRDLDVNTLSEECSRKSMITHTREVESGGEEAIASCEDSFDIEVIEAESIVEPVEKSTFEESCILVEGDELHSVSQGSKKHKSYKKKIYDVLSVKLRSRRKQDLCISDHEDLSDKNDAAAGAMSPALALEYDTRKLHDDHSSCDFGWELL